MEYRPHFFVLALFGLLFLLDAASVCFYTLVLCTGNHSSFEILHLTMSTSALQAVTAFGIYYLCTRHRQKSVKIPYLLAFGFIFLANLVISVSVSARAAIDLCSVFSSFDASDTDCKWGGLSIIFPWVTTIFSAGGLIITIAERHLAPVEVLTKPARKQLDLERRKWQEDCFDANLRTSIHDPDASQPFDPYLGHEVIMYPQPIYRNINVPDSDSSIPPVPPQPEQAPEISRQEACFRELFPHLVEDKAEVSGSTDSDLGSHEQVITIGNPDAVIQENPKYWGYTNEEEETDSEEEPRRRRRRRRRPRPTLRRRAESGSVRPEKTFMIRFEDPIAVPLRDIAPVESPADSDDSVPYTVVAL